MSEKDTALENLQNNISKNESQKKSNVTLFEFINLKSKANITYEATFSAQKVHPILKIPGTDRIVGGSICVHTGKIIFLRPILSGEGG